MSKWGEPFNTSTSRFDLSGCPLWSPTVISVKQILCVLTLAGEVRHARGCEWTSQVCLAKTWLRRKAPPPGDRDPLAPCGTDVNWTYSSTESSHPVWKHMRVNCSPTPPWRSHTATVHLGEPKGGFYRKHNRINGQGLAQKCDFMD